MRSVGSSSRRSRGGGGGAILGSAECLAAWVARGPAEGDGGAGGDIGGAIKCGAEREADCGADCGAEWEADCGADCGTALAAAAPRCDGACPAGGCGPRLAGGWDVGRWEVAGWEVAGWDVGCRDVGGWDAVDAGRPCSSTRGIAPLSDSTRSMIACGAVSSGSLARRRRRPPGDTELAPYCASRSATVRGVPSPESSPRLFIVFTVPRP
jgi:hypothetical protein